MPRILALQHLFIHVLLQYLHPSTGLTCGALWKWELSCLQAQGSVMTHEVQGHGEGNASVDRLVAFVL